MESVFITGCSSGIGRAGAMVFARNGYRVFATVRNSGDAESLANWAAGQHAALHPVIMDVTESDQVARGVQEALAVAGRLDALVNNAGIAVPGTFERLPLSEWERVMQVNFFGPVRVTRAVLPQMRKQGSGRIIMVSSLSALVGLPGMAPYSASKAALELASESLRLEVDRFGIFVSVVEPGVVATAMPVKISGDLAATGDPPYAELLRHLHAQSVAGTGRGEDPMRVAELLLEIARAPKPAFRYPAGRQAHEVLKAVAALDAPGRDAFIRSVDSTEWWSEGLSKAVKSSK
ncbi:MAG: SDR family oxidoreductase [Gammaproteobacteria bacterium]|nr:SDR family oxidoreductase [Gammaproteobacteria bacterium]